MGNILNRKDPLFLLFTILVWLVLLYITAPGVFVLSDELHYISLAYNFSENFSLNSKGYYYESLIHQEPPLKGPHNPGFQMLLGMFFKIFGFDEKTILMYNYLILFFFTISFYYFLKKYLCNEKSAYTIILLFIGFPLVNMYSQIIMAEITIIASTFLLLFLMFYYEPRRNRYLYYFILSLVFWYCFLIRPNVILLLPVFIFYLYKKSGFKEVIRVLLVGVLFLPAVVMLTQNKIEFPYNPIYSLKHYTSSTIEALNLIIQNFKLNVKRIWEYFPNLRYTINKVLFYQIAFLASFSFSYLDDKQKNLYKIIFSYFTLNTIMLLSFYDNYQWKGLRVSIQFVPFFISFIVMAFQNLTMQKEYIYKFASVIILSFILVVFYSLSIFSIKERYQVIEKKYAEQKQFEEFFFKYLDKKKPYNILTNIDLRRGYIEFPQSTFTFILNRQSFNRESFQVVNRKMNYDYILLFNNKEVKFLKSFGYSLIGNEKFFYVYKKTNNMSF
jgi:4-amino-4-deoxy-L-arabinose transferase-like glycosyltransferase